MTSAFEELFSIANAFHDIPMAGRTDAWILSDAAAAHGIPADSADLARFPRRVRAAPRRRNRRQRDRGTTPVRGGRYGVMPGVRALLDALVDRPDAYLALLTGNYETGAQLKLEHFDLWRYFRAGRLATAPPIAMDWCRRRSRASPPVAVRRSRLQTPSSLATRRSTWRARRPAARD